MKVIGCFAAIMLLAIFFFGCGSDACDEAKVGNTKIITPISYNYGVLYFPCTGAIFANSLAAYRKQNPYVGVSVCGDGTGPQGKDVGYYVNVNVQ